MSTLSRSRLRLTFPLSVSQVEVLRLAGTAPMGESPVSEEIVMQNTGKRTSQGADNTRQGEIILEKRWNRAIFVSGLAAIGLLAFFLVLASYD
ncbi:hypothetical protein [Roseibium aggregatum]|uniref:Uncharacterized protein n=1 Tax=Roseibium aggregatum TaxID=187304 RepID=A0A926S6P9_9HYPH|nr:hypothetical protein [Roseibium aggregatum]MBD1548768.1 hypothetical protein [Roseibium aggregatum]